MSEKNVPLIWYQFCKLDYKSLLRSSLTDTKLSSLYRESGKKATRRAQPQHFALDIGRNLSLKLTLSAHCITPNTATVEKIGGAA